MVFAFVIESQAAAASPGKNPGAAAGNAQASGGDAAGGDAAGSWAPAAA